MNRIITRRDINIMAKENEASSSQGEKEHNSKSIDPPKSDDDKSVIALSSSPKYSQMFRAFFSHPFVSTFVAPLTIALITVGITLFVSTASTDTKISELTTDVQIISSQVSQIFDSIKRLDSRIDTVADRTPSQTEVSITVRPLQNFVDASENDFGILDAYAEESKPLSATLVFNSANSDEYTASEIAGQKLLLPYIADGQECFFYGQVDQNGRWDGNCLINIYKRGILVLITEAEYTNGRLLTFQQAFPTTTGNNKAVWAISKRTAHQGFSSGETWYYFRKGDYAQPFLYDNVTENDVLSVADFQNKVGKVLEGYYQGNSSNGKFNDSTGNAYMVKFFENGTVSENGTVRTLYCGNIKNGNFDDSTGNAWMIGKSDLQSNYSYYKGPFSNGSASQNSKYWEVNISQTRINELLAGMKFGCELNWV